MQNTHMKNQIVGCAVALVAGMFGVMASAADEGIALFSRDSGFISGWTATTWGKGLEAKKEDRGGGSVVVATPAENAEPWGGMALRVGYGESMADRAIPIDGALREKGVVVMKLNSVPVHGNPSPTPQSLKISLGFSVDGKLKEVTPMPISNFVVGGGLDGAPGSWLELRIPISTMLAKLSGSATPEGLASIGIQYVEKPTFEILVGDCQLLTE